MVFCNNVFYYVGLGSEEFGTKYAYPTPLRGEYTTETSKRYKEIMGNLLSLIRRGGKLFFHNNNTKLNPNLNPVMRTYTAETRTDIKEIATDIYQRID